MKEKQLIGIGIMLVIMLSITPIVNSISIKENYNIDNNLDKEKEECNCDITINDDIVNNDEKKDFELKNPSNNTYQLGIKEGGMPLPPGKNFSGKSPSSWDWRNKDGKDWTTSIKSQGNCGSCYAFGTYAAMESCIKIKNNDPDLSIDLSEQYMVSCGKEWSSGIFGCDGAYAFSAVQFIDVYGAITESCFSYSSGNGNVPPCSNKCSNWKDLKIYIKDWGSVSATQSSIKNALIKYGPLPTVMKVYNNFYGYSGGIYQPSGSYEGLHLVTIVGYNDNSNYWICKNSWGKNWGENGWFRIKYGVCEIEEDTVYLEIPGNQNLFSEIKCGTETSKRKGDIYNYNNCKISMSEGIFAGDATAWYEFNLGDLIVADGMEIGIEFADWGWIGDGPDLYVYDWANSKYTKLGKDLGNNDDFKWVWKKTTNSNNYISSSGKVEVKVWTEDDDHTILFHVGVRGKYFIADLECSGDLNFGQVSPGQEIEKVIKVENVGRQGTKLDWKIDNWPSWGTWKFSPSSGDNLKPEDGYVNVYVTFRAPTTPANHSGEVLIINENEPSDYEFIEASVSVRKSKNIDKNYINFLTEKLQNLISKPLFSLLFKF